MTRSREISVRLALGAARSRIVRQLLVERVLISSLGGFAGFWLATWGVRAFALAATGAGLSDQIAGDWFDQILDYSMDYRVFAFVTAISIGTGLLFGLAPARQLSMLDVNRALKHGTRTGGGGRAGRLSAILVVAEMALTVVLLAGAGVMICCSRRRMPRSICCINSRDAPACGSSREPGYRLAASPVRCETKCMRSIRCCRYNSVLSRSPIVWPNGTNIAR